MKGINDRSAIFSIAGKTCFLFAVAFMLLPLSVEAQCGQWDIGGNWNAVIDKGPTEFLKNVTQSGTSVSGKAFIESAYNPYQEGGTVKGQLQGDKVSLYIEWESPSLKVVFNEYFTGTIGPDEKIKGQADIAALAGVVHTSWSSDRPMKCLFQTVHKLGVKPTTPTKPVEPASATMKAPGIIASPNNIAVPIVRASGKTTLTWDGGPDHPYAEIWVKVDDQDETKVLEKGKGSLEVTVEPGKTYLYILTDAGKTLATVTVKFHR